MVITTVSNVQVINLGPLTTTYTVPESCSTTTDLMAAVTSDPDMVDFAESCYLTQTIGDCSPSGSLIDEILATRQDGQLMVLYHSPANICPDAWTTVGVAVRDSDGSLSSTGIFAVTEYLDYNGEAQETPRWMPHPHRVMPALENDETCVLCCPSGFRGNLYGHCVSNYPIESYTATTTCNIWADGNFVSENFTITNNGVPITGFQEVIGPASTPVTTTTIIGTLDPETYTQSDFTGITNQPVLILVTGGASRSSSNGGAESSTSTPNAAPCGEGALSGNFIAVVAIWGVATLVGAGFMLQV